MTLRRPTVVGLLAGAVLLGTVPLAHAAFRDDAAAEASIGMAVLAPPTGVSMSKSCVLDLLGLALSGRFTVSWTPSASEWATGQQVVFMTGGGTVLETRSVSVSATSAYLDVSLPVGSYKATVRSTYGTSWTKETTSNAVSC